MFLSEQLQKKWEPVLNHGGLGAIKDNYRRAVTAVVLENQEKALREEKSALFEDAATITLLVQVLQLSTVMIQFSSRSFAALFLT